jgi:N-acetyl-anhydromuramyl-L-alanine amidase AmpD
MSSKNIILKFGSEGELVGILQGILGIRVDNHFGKLTHTAVTKFQKSKKLAADGIVGPLTWKSLGYDPIEFELDTDRSSYENWIEKYHLPKGEYIHKITNKEWIMLHHTAGRHNPYKCIDHWARDSRGRVGTNYVIGGTSSNGKDTKHDGKVLRAIDDEYFGWHIGKGGIYALKENSISIEVCSAGGLKQKNGKWYTWFKEEVDPSQVCILDKPFRGYKAFHKYSEEQIKSLKALLIFLGEKHSINIKEGMAAMLHSNVNAFEWNKAVCEGKIKGIINHTNVRKDKSDMFPQPELIEMLLSL